jgi:hypothetical protein
MTKIEIMMQALGWLGMGLILFGMRQKGRENRQILMGTGAGFLAIMAAWPEFQPVFFVLQAALALVGFINIKPNRQLITLPIVFLSAVVGSFFAIKSSFGPDTWLAVAGLVGIALGYTDSPEREGGNQSLWFGIGGAGMVGYSTFGILAGVWQAWPFLILNIPFCVLGFRDTIRERRGRKKK